MSIVESFIDSFRHFHSDVVAVAADGIEGEVGALTEDLTAGVATVLVAGLRLILAVPIPGMESANLRPELSTS